MLPTLVSMAVFGYYPKLDVLIKSLYRWTPGQIQEYVGPNNFLEAFSDPLFWQSFQVVLIMLAANLFKFWPSILVAIALHRMRSERWRYIYQVMFVIPMVIPGMVWLLIWKSFFDPDFGLLNRFLSASGGMTVLAWLDGTSATPGAMPRLAATLDPVIEGYTKPIFGSVWGLMVPGAIWLTLAGSTANERGQSRSRWIGYTVVLAIAAAGPYAFPQSFSSLVALALSLAGLVAAVIALARTLGPGWVIWPFWWILAWWACADAPWRAPVLLGAGILTAEAAHATLPRLRAPDALRWAGLIVIGTATLLVAFGTIWTEPTNQFVEGRPAWLGHRDLVLPSLIVWGFPWVATIGVLLYLAGLQQIGDDVYEAAELDGVGPIGKAFYIELPLIMTQIRINLIFVTIGTLTSYESFLILLGNEGGPGNVGMVPGLYMYKSAFIDFRYGYACALGMVLFVIILLLTIVYQKFVKVEK